MTGSVDRYRRFYEILPGAMSWSFLIVLIVLSFFAPVAAAIIVLFYLLYWWYFKMVIVSFVLVRAYYRLKHDTSVDWQKKLAKNYPDYGRVHHLMVVATYKEELPILESTIQALKDSALPKEQIIVLLATEARDKERARRNATALRARFGKTFRAFLVSEHPADIVGEVKGKGSNIRFAAKSQLKTILGFGVDPADTVVTTLDSDHRVHRQFLSALTYAYLAEPERLRRTFQGVPLYFNNIWDVPVLMRIIAMGSSFWQMVESIRSYRLRNFSSQSQSLAALILTDFWSNQTIVEDGHQYWRSYFTFKGDYGVVPIFVPIYYDAVSAESKWQTMKEQYLQQRRWAWGVSDIPYVLPRLWRMKTVPLLEKLNQTFRIFDGYISWAVGSLILAFVGWMPVWFHPDFQSTTFGANFPVLYRYLLSVSTIGLVVTLTIATLMLPPYPRRYRGLRILMDWIYTPIFTPFSHIIFGCLPALDSQTRLMLGKYLEFRVTPKNTEHRSGAKSD